MRDSNFALRASKAAVVSSLGLLGLLCTSAAFSQTPTPGAAVAERFTATTTAMVPRDVTLRIDVREWSDDAARAAVIAALAQPSDVSKALSALPTVGYVWRGDSAVGYSVKYAHRAPVPEGERITLVTDKRLGSYDFKPWAADQPASTELEYSVVELYLDQSGRGAGTMSHAAEVAIDAATALVTLGADAPRLLANVKLEPKPYSSGGK
jgi:hypothetical protein